MAITKQQYLANLQIKVDKAVRVKSAAVRRRKRIITGILALGTIVGLVFGYTSTSGEKNKACSAYISATSGTEEARVPYEYLDNKDLFDLWNKNDLGNDINAILSGGKLLYRSGISAFPTFDNSGTKIVSSSGEEKSLGVEASYINLKDDCVFYRNDADRKLYSYNLGTSEQHLIYDGNVGEVLITNNMVYCVDYSSDSSIVSMNLQGEEMQIVVREPVSSFAICGNTILYLDTSQKLKKTEVYGSTTVTIVGNIERFFVDGRVYAESDNTIFSFTPLGYDSSLVYRTDEASLRLVGVSDGTVFYQENGELKCINGDMKSTLFLEQHKIYSSLTKSGTEVLSVIALDIADGNGLKRTLLEVSVADIAGGD